MGGLGRTAQSTPCAARTPGCGVLGRHTVPVSAATVSDEDLTACWLRAAADLGISVVVPYALLPAREDAWCAHVAHFGGESGLLVCRWDQDKREDIRLATQVSGIMVSWIKPLDFANYSRRRFEAHLNHIGWSGPPQLRPAWYTGKRLPYGGSHQRGG